MICDHTALEKVNESNIFLIFGDFVLLSEARGPNLEPAVDKNHTFIPFFVYRPSKFKEGYGQNVDF